VARVRETSKAFLNKRTHGKTLIIYQAKFWQAQGPFPVCLALDWENSASGGCTLPTHTDNFGYYRLVDAEPLSALRFCTESIKGDKVIAAH
jgi:hypothetical protein